MWRSKHNRKASTLLYGHKTKWPPLTSSSCELRLLPSPWRSGPAPRHLVGPGAIYQREVIQEKTNLLICFIIVVAWHSGRGLRSTRHAARSHVDGLRVGVNLWAGKREIKTHKPKMKFEDNLTFLQAKHSHCAMIHSAFTHWLVFMWLLLGYSAGF